MGLLAVEKVHWSEAPLRTALSWSRALRRALLLLLMLSVAGAVFWGSPVQAEDELNCVLCHKFRGLSRIDENGKFRLFYINENLFMKGPHKRVMCLDCHRDIEKIPHDPAKKVDCTVECHLTEPSGKQKFSHKPVAEILEKSVHGRLEEDGKPKEHQEDYPSCKDCHEQPLYRPISFFKGVAAGVSRRGLSRCKTCHQTGDFAEDFYNHVTSRLQKTRESKEIVEVCARCHEDRGIQQRHGLDDVVASYKDTFHYKAVRFGSDETADCLDCHVVYGESVHSVESMESPSAASNKANVAQTCRNAECHHEAGENIASYRVHVDYNNKDKNPMEYYMLKFFTGLMAAVLYFFIVLIFLELLRRLFPNFSFGKKEPLDDHTIAAAKPGSEGGE